MSQRKIQVFEGGALSYGSHTGRHVGEMLAAILEQVGQEGEPWARQRVRVTVEVLGIDDQRWNIVGVPK